MNNMDAVIARYAVGDFDDSTPLREIGVESLALLRIIVDLATDPAQQVWPERLATVRTVGELKARLSGSATTTEVSG